MFADVDPRCTGGDGFELAAVLRRRVRFKIKAILLSQTSGKEDVDATPGLGPRVLVCQSLQTSDMVHP